MSTKVCVYVFFCFCPPCGSPCYPFPSPFAGSFAFGKVFGVSHTISCFTHEKSPGLQPSKSGLGFVFYKQISVGVMGAVPFPLVLLALFWFYVGALRWSHDTGLIWVGLLTFFPLRAEFPLCESGFSFSYDMTMQNYLPWGS
jgi:hypothetical protein